ncbi:prospero homeobox protein 1a isoform X1 [Brienomyrus brachyistius]|uniref:prospero homeobox protein 1a isoform X1 n=1 Tax=Brienomyrus brachyistius TaxID=42636 RepID=UPI0020B356BD|nr:prospero homeobox protein 1a isoform X1 [Brienomyrus brachyistius]XP_048830558.1 prospero homeobox protein 1a isoform X1 [Brienomyrus brachyistius]XP_048830559.1 prospero homeobox protein 1a isoform X1 [Brienomyrus brachyistius]XP_048830560.1 prospero homeobox protein 1a isoform X1 [Brienomyrus brachyistius]
MPDHDSAALLSRQTKRRRVDIGVKRTVGTASVAFARAKASIFSAMNPHIADQDVECSVVQHADGEKSNVLRKLLKRANSYEDAMMPFPGATIISQLLKNNMTKNGGNEPSFQGSGLSSTGSEIHQEDMCSNSSRESPQDCLSPFSRPSMSQFDIERLSDEHLRAKRARVENIIRGMSHSPSVTLRPSESDREGVPQPPGSPRESYRENKRKQKLPQQQQQSFRQLVSARKEQKHEERRQLKLQLEDMQKQLRQLQEKFYQIYDSTDSENDEDGNLSEDSLRSDGMDRRAHDSVADRSDNEMSDLDPGHFLDRARALIQEQSVMAEGDKPKRDGPRGKGHGPSSMHAEGKQLAETLKQELNTAMSQVVDTVVKVFAKPPRPVPQVFPSHPMPQDRFPVNGENPNFHTANQRLQCFGDVIIPNPLDTFGSIQVPPSNDQTEALPLVVRKNSSDQSSSLPTPGGHHHPSLHPSPLSATMGFSPPSFRHPFPLPLMGYPFQNPLAAPSGSYPGKDRASPESLDLSRETTSLRTKMSSNHLNHHRSCSPTHPGSTAEGLSLSLIKSECGDLQEMSDISPYSGSTIQEGLSPNHLKKAKLMFFYTRYPSSNMLKMFFSDVKFNRCITSQLIKWFSNFREFYYIQMEKFARQAINDGVTGVEELSVSRDCELYRALNMHYNKANDFEQVPERFLEVAQITLREFFNAIVAGKDVDPSWKKAIYKVICKLDSEVPEIFKSPNCLQELLHE